MGFKLAQKLRQGISEWGGALGDDENGTRGRESGRKSVGKGDSMRQGSMRVN